MGGSTNSGGQASGGTRHEKGCRAPYPVLCTDNPRYRSHRPDPHRTPQIGEDNRGECRRACGGATPRDQRLFLFHGMAFATHYGTCARVVSRPIADCCSAHLNDIGGTLFGHDEPRYQGDLSYMDANLFCSSCRNIAVSLVSTDLIAPKQDVIRGETDR